MPFHVGLVARGLFFVPAFWRLPVAFFLARLGETIVGGWLLFVLLRWGWNMGGELDAARAEGEPVSALERAGQFLTTGVSPGSVSVLPTPTRVSREDFVRAQRNAAPPPPAPIQADPVEVSASAPVSETVDGAGGSGVEGWSVVECEGALYCLVSGGGGGQLFCYSCSAARPGAVWPCGVVVPEWCP